MISRLRATVFSVALILVFAAQENVHADSISERYSSWMSVAPKCEWLKKEAKQSLDSKAVKSKKMASPSKEKCDDGDSTLFNGMLCYVDIKEGCEAVEKAQDATGRWHRSARLANDPSLRGHTSFSPDMAIGVQLYLLKTNNRSAAIAWVNWLESSVACAVPSPSGCLLKSPFPRFCTDDEKEKGCTMRPGDAAMLAATLRRLNVLPKIDTTLGAYLAQFESIFPENLVVDASLNRPGYSRHLVAASILVGGLALQKEDHPALTQSSQILAAKEPLNAFFQAISGMNKNDLSDLILDLCPRVDELENPKTEWAWERTDSVMAWKESMIWDCMFVAKLARLHGGP